MELGFTELQRVLFYDAVMFTALRAKLIFINGTNANVKARYIMPQNDTR